MKGDNIEKVPSTPSSERKSFREEVATVTVDNAKEDLRFSSTSVQHRKLESFHINLISIGGTVGTALFIYMGSGLTAGGPANLLLGYAWWTSVIFAVAECQRELIVRWPTDSALSRNGARYVDPAIGFALGYNFFLYQAALVLFEVTALGVFLDFWPSSRGLNPAITISAMIAAYAVLNLWDTRFFGNAEFGFAMGKVLLIIGLLLYTFIAMLGGNPLHDRFGFRYWNNPGAMTGPYPAHGATLNRFEGFVACVINACFTIAGPDYLSVVAGEARNPRPTMNKAFKATIYRLCIFFLGSALAIGILVPYDSPSLLSAQSTGTGAAKSPYVVSMQLLAIPVLPSIVNALIITSVFSAGNAFLFCASRTLAQLARDGHAPRVFEKRNRNGVPWVAVTLVLLLSLLSYCQVSKGASVVITWITGLVGSAQLVNWAAMAFTWIRWNAGMKAAGIPRETLHARSVLQPFAAWYALICSIVVMLIQGYGVFLKNSWDTSTFIFSYAMPIVFVVLVVGWKVIKRTRFYRASEIDVTTHIDDPQFDAQEYAEDEANMGWFRRALRAVF